MGSAYPMVEYRAQFRGTPASVREARQAILDYARLCGFGSRETYEIALGAGEALANAVEHGAKNLGHMTVACRFEDGVLVIEVSDSGAGFDLGRLEVRRRDPDAVRGFGISIMRAVMDEVEYHGRGSTVRLHKRRPLPNTDALEKTEEA